MERRRFACEADAGGAIAEDEGHGVGRRGRPAAPWRSHEVHSRVQAQWPRQQRAPRGRPPKDEPAQEALGYRLHLASKALAPPVAPCGWLVLATTVDAQTSDDAEIVRAYRDQTTTVEPGFRWIKHPAAISPVWLEKPKRIAALALLTGVGFLVWPDPASRASVRAAASAVNTGE